MILSSVLFEHLPPPCNYDTAGTAACQSANTCPERVGLFKLQQIKLKGRRKRLMLEKKEEMGRSGN